MNKNKWTDRNPKIYIESSTPQEKQKHKGWFYKYPEQKFYRWNDFMTTLAKNR